MKEKNTEAIKGGMAKGDARPASERTSITGDDCLRRSPKPWKPMPCGRVIWWRATAGRNLCSSPQHSTQTRLYCMPRHFAMHLKKWCCRMRYQLSAA